MTSITNISVIGLEHRLGENNAYGMSRGLVSVRNTNLIFVETDGGITGVGEASGPCAMISAALDILKPYFIGRDLYDHSQVPSYFFAQQYHLGIQNTLTSCLGGIDIAAHDAIGKLAKVPVYQLLGGLNERRLPAYASDGYFATHPKNQLADQLKAVRDKGFPGVKIKIGRNPADDEERVSFARDVLGPEVSLMVDVNGNYTVGVALQSMIRIQDYNVQFYEEPLAPTDFSGYAALHSRSPIPIATGEALYTPHEFKRLMDINGADIWQPDLTLCGGLSAAREISTLARLSHVRLSPHIWGGAVGLSAALHFLSAQVTWPHTDNVPYPPLLEYDQGENALRDNILMTPIPCVDGHLIVPDGPGLGIELNWDAVEKYRVT